MQSTFGWNGLPAVVTLVGLDKMGARDVGSGNPAFIDVASNVPQVPVDDVVCPNHLMENC